MAAAVARLAEAGCETPRLDAELLLADALGWDRSELYLRDHEQPPGFDERVRRRAAREPVAYITGRRAFRRIELQVDRRVLIPRPETETLVEPALDSAAAAGPSTRTYPPSGEAASSLRRFSSASRAAVNSSRSPARIASAASRAERSASYMPSPVSGSTSPAASPTSAARPRAISVRAERYGSR